MVGNIEKIVFLSFLLSTRTATGNDGVIMEKLALLEKTVASLQFVVTTQQDEIETLKSRDCREISKRFIMESEGPVAFSSVMEPVAAHHNNQEIIRFETVLTNFGGGYNNDTGIFVAPVSGIYLITCSVLDHQETDAGNVMVHAEILKNHEVLARVFARAESNDHRDQGANTIIVKVEAGDQLYVRTVDSKDLGVGGERYTSFSGFLLWQME